MLQRRHPGSINDMASQIQTEAAFIGGLRIVARLYDSSTEVLPLCGLHDSRLLEHILHWVGRREYSSTATLSTTEEQICLARYFTANRDINIYSYGGYLCSNGIILLPFADWVREYRWTCES